jgi:hypothetical protein
MRNAHYLLLLLLAACSDNTTGRPDLTGADLLPPDIFSYQLDTGLPPGKDGGGDAPQRLDSGRPDGAPGVLRPPFTLNFDGNNGGLKSNGKDWEWGVLAFRAGSGCESGIAPPSSGHSGSGVWGTKLNDCYSPLSNEATSGSGGTCSNQDPNDDSILSFKVQIPLGYTMAKLLYYDWTDVYYPFDWHEVRVIDGPTSTVVKQYCFGGYTKPTAWTYRSISLSKWAGKTVTIEFHFMASSVVNYAGWYIDDLSVKNI